VRITRVVLTHHHHDHVEQHPAYAPAPCCAHVDELPLLDFAAQPLRDGDVIAAGRSAKGISKLPLTAHAA
jgi:glyoxylase-like metal-dependent hydrolase (beta-lactamase superfamily II)